MLKSVKGMKKLVLFSTALMLSGQVLANSSTLENGATQLPQEATTLYTMSNPSGGTSVKVDKKNPDELIRTVADITFKRFANEQPEIRKSPNILKDIVREELLPYINYQYAAYKVLGKNFKKTTKEDRAAFVPVFRDYLVTSYAQVFTLYKQQEVRIEPPKFGKKKNIASVKAMVLESGRDPIEISFRIRKSKKTNEWKAYDMVAEGVSLLDSKQAELSSIIRQKGLAFVTDMLKEKAQKDIVFQ